MTLPPFASTPRLLRLFKLILYPLNYLEDYSKKYGDIFALGSSETPFVYISNPEGIQEITLKVILKAVFGIASGSRYEQLKNLLRSWLAFFDSPANAAVIFFPFLQKDWGNWTPWGRFIRIKAAIDKLIYAEIKERRQQKEHTGQDILTLLMLAKDEDGNPMSNQELHDELITLLIAGHETTASSLTWALYWIHYCPEVENKLRSHLSNLGNNPDLLDMMKFPYLDAVCSETLRIYPVVLTTFLRILQTPLELMGYQFKPGTVFAPAIYLVHHREDIYSQPKQFRPERFLERQFSPYEYFPFGGGSRRCIGMELAKMEMKLVLAKILSKYQLKLCSHRPLKPVRRGLTVAPPTGFKMLVSNNLEYSKS